MSSFQKPSGWKEWTCVIIGTVIGAFALNLFEALALGLVLGTAINGALICAVYCFNRSRLIEWWNRSPRPLGYVQEPSAVSSERLNFAIDGRRSDGTGAIDPGPASHKPRQLSQLSSLSGGSDDQVWQTFLEYEPSISEAVERLSSLSPKNVQEFRALFLQHPDCSRIKEFEDEAIRRVQGPPFVADASLQAYGSLNPEDGRLGDKFVRVVGVIGKPKDLERTVAQVRKKVPPREKLEQDPDAPAGFATSSPQVLSQTFKAVSSSKNSPVKWLLGVAAAALVIGGSLPLLPWDSMLPDPDHMTGWMTGECMKQTKAGAWILLHKTVSGKLSISCRLQEVSHGIFHPFDVNDELWCKHQWKFRCGAEDMTVTSEDLATVDMKR
jgi:hypothetical protein